MPGNDRCHQFELVELVEPAGTDRLEVRRAVLAVFAGLVGLAIGSFLNVVLYRVPRGESVAHPRSRCPSCQTPIAWHDNVPLVSWLVLRGKCRACREPISARYPLIELATGAAFAVAALLLTT